MNNLTVTLDVRIVHVSSAFPHSSCLPLFLSLHFGGVRNIFASDLLHNSIKLFDAALPISWIHWRYSVHVIMPIADACSSYHSQPPISPWLHGVYDRRLAWKIIALNAAAILNAMSRSRWPRYETMPTDRSPYIEELILYIWTSIGRLLSWHEVVREACAN